MANEYLPTEDERWRAALQAQREPARQGLHRAVGMPDLLTAVLAAAHGLTVVHYDADFETAATVVSFRAGVGRPARRCLTGEPRLNTAKPRR